MEKAKLVGAKTQRERDYITAIETFYKDNDKLDHRTRALAYEKAMDQLQARYPDDHGSYCRLASCLARCCWN